jgi:hypothetical protein
LAAIGLNDAADLLQPALPPGTTTPPQVTGGAPTPPLRLEVLKARIASLLGTRAELVDVISVSNVPSTRPLMVDVVYAAHGSPYYSPEKLNAVVWANKDSVGFSCFLRSFEWFAFVILRHRY